MIFYVSGGMAIRSGNNDAGAEDCERLESACSRLRNMLGDIPAYYWYTTPLDSIKALVQANISNSLIQDQYAEHGDGFV